MKTQFTVDKEFIKEAYNSACPDWKAKLKNKFPEAFESELEVGKWYKMPKYGDAIFCITKIQNSRCFAYGINYMGEWRDEKDFATTDSPEEFILATEKEVETALIAEAKRRGFEAGIKFKPIDGSERICTFLGCEIYIGANIITANVYENEWEKDGKYISSNPAIFENGKWAEIISEPIEVTLEEIAEKFNVNVEQLKIKK